MLEAHLTSTVSAARCIVEMEADRASRLGRPFAIIALGSDARSVNLGARMARAATHFLGDARDVRVVPLDEGTLIIARRSLDEAARLAREACGRLWERFGEMRAGIVARPAGWRARRSDFDATLAALDLDAALAALEKAREADARVAIVSSGGLLRTDLLAAKCPLSGECADLVVLADREQRIVEVVDCSLYPRGTPPDCSQWCVKLPRPRR